MLIMSHISSFKPRQSHYSIRRNPHKKKYLPETLSVKEMHNMFLELYQIQVAYHTYWHIFTENFKISFGLPRSDTCTLCDTLKQQIESCNCNEDKVKLMNQKQIHISKAEAFYNLKRSYKERARRGIATVITFDYMQNLPVPHLRSNVIYYSRQLWHYCFGVHDLSNDEVTMFTYHEGIGNKGQNEVTSLLLGYLKGKNCLKNELIVISDGCLGQNKNFCMVYFLYMLVHCF